MDELSQLIIQVEGQYFDRKSLWEGPAGGKRVRNRREVRDQIAEYVAAFANADGGTLVLGAEDNGTVTGHGYPDDAVDEMLQTPANRLNPPQSKGKRVNCLGQEVLVFEVAAAERAVMVVGDGFPRRVHDRVVLESEENINAIKARGRTESIEGEATAGIEVGELDSDLIDRARRGAGLAELDAKQYLCERRLADYRGSKRGSELILRKGALLLFAQSGRDIDHPNAAVRVFRANGTERLTGARHNVQELQRVEGALPRVIQSAYETVGGQIRRSTRLHDLFLERCRNTPRSRGRKRW